MRRTFSAIIAAAATLGIATPIAAQTAPDPSSGELRLELLDQTFDLAPNGTIELTFRLVGDLDGLTELTTPPPSTTTSTTTTPTTTPAATPVAIDDPTTSTPSGTAVVDEPAPEPEPPIQLTARILNFAPVDQVVDLTGRLGPDPQSSRFTSPIDGVDQTEVRSQITVESATSATLRLSVPTDAEPSVAERLKFNVDGIYPILVELFAGDQVVARHGTVVERRSTAGRVPPPIDLAFLAVVDDPGPTGDDRTMQDRIDAVRGLGIDARELDSGLTLAIPPSVATAAISAGALPSDPDLFADDELLAAPATPFDVSSATAVDRVDAFVNQLRAGETEIADALSVLPVRDVWPVTTALSGAAAQTLRDLGVRYLAMTAAVYAATVADDDDAPLPAVDRFIALDLPDGTTMPLIIIDEAFGSVFTTATTDSILAESTPAEWAIQTIAALRLDQSATAAGSTRPERSHVIATPDLGVFDPRLIVELERMAETTDAIRLVLASDIATRTDAQPRFQGATLPEIAGPPLAERLDHLATAQTTIDSTLSMLSPDDARRSDWSNRLDRLVSTAFSDDEVDAEIELLLDDAEVIRGGVVPPVPFTFTLAGREGDINLRIGNRLGEPITVVVRASSPRLTFSDGDVTVTLPPRQDTTVTLAVVARSRGTSPVTIDILTPSGEPIVEPITLTSRVNAFAGIGQVLTGAFLLVLVTWWFSNWRKRRRALAPPEAEPAPAG